MPNTHQPDVPEEVEAIRREIEKVLNSHDDAGNKIGNYKFGVYAFYDYDGEPIYVGQTSERLRTRIRRHLTNQRTDAVAMNVLDPFEVAEVEMWPLAELEHRAPTEPEAKYMLEAAENTVFQKVLGESSFKAVLNEKEIPFVGSIPLSKSYRFKIIPDSVYSLRSHPDIRIARRAQTIAALARVISERQVTKGLRQTLVTQARRLERLASQRFNAVQGEIPEEQLGEETGETID